MYRLSGADKALLRAIRILPLLLCFIRIWDEYVHFLEESQSQDYSAEMVSALRFGSCEV